MLQWMEDAGLKWHPRFFMTDFSEREISAIEEVFPDCKVFLCDFHREQAWTRWTSKIDNGVSMSKDKVLAMMRRCAHATTPEQYQHAVAQLKKSPEWHTNTRLVHSSMDAPLQALGLGLPI